MKTLLRVLKKAVVTEYYRQNVVFYGAILFFAGGILRANEHIRIGNLIIKHPSLLLVTFGVWALHTLKTILFVRRLQNEKQNEFLYHLRQLSLPKRILLWSFTQFLLIQPTTIYSLFLCYLAINSNQYYAIIGIIAVNICFLIAGFVAYDYRLKRPNSESVIQKPLARITPQFRTLQYFFYFRNLITKQPVLYLLSMLWALFMMIGVSNLYFTDDYDERLFAIAALFIVVGFMPISQHYYEFENHKIIFFRNLPLPLHQRFFIVILSFLWVIIPLIYVIFNNLPTNISLIWKLGLVFYILCFLMFIYSFSFIKLQNVENFWKYIFAFIIINFLMIMFKIPIWFLATLHICCSFIIYKKRFYHSEYQPLQA